MNELNRFDDEFAKVVYCKECKYRNTNKCPMIDFIPHPKTDKIYKYNKNKGNIMLWVSPYESDGDIEVPVYPAD